LADLGVTNKQQELIPAMSRKWKQINKFIEVFSHALSSSPLKLDQPVKVVDFGSGKGYLTFAIHDYLRHSLKAEGVVTGVELREDMVTLCNNAAQRLEHPGLSFQHGDVRSFAPTPIDVMIALHACDIATDYAIHMGIRSGQPSSCARRVATNRSACRSRARRCSSRCCNMDCILASRPKWSPTACVPCSLKPAVMKPKCSSSSPWSTPTKTK
jgi:Protein-L-isoaspartate(D-aspartate) O-methyltransferase (PCMT).